eukprot:GHVT01075282.1.p1 GENE.GHVT01075282.1~~GHVT01075282.1.p1  ORF type:complete len:151 (-),score=16.73 GHVT01075282.1:381-833(-)
MARKWRGALYLSTSLLHYPLTLLPPSLSRSLPPCSPPFSFPPCLLPMSRLNGWRSHCTSVVKVSRTLRSGWAAAAWLKFPFRAACLRGCWRSVRPSVRPSIRGLASPQRNCGARFPPVGLHRQWRPWETRKADLHTEETGGRLQPTLHKL